MASDTNEKVVSLLNDLIETCRDGKNGFSTAADGAERADLKDVFTRYANQRAQFSQELEVLVTGLGGKPADMGHVAAAAHRGWINIKTAVAGNEDKAVLSECERGEDYAKKAYTDALKETLPQAVLSVVQRQAADVLKAHDNVRDLRDAEIAMAKSSH